MGIPAESTEGAEAVEAVRDGVVESSVVCIAVRMDRGGTCASVPVCRRQVQNFAQLWLDGLRSRVALTTPGPSCCDSTTLSTIPKLFSHFELGEPPSRLRLQTTTALRHHSLHSRQGMVSAKLSHGSGG